MNVLVDDQLLAAFLRRSWSPSGGDRVWTTGCWYVRLCTAVALRRRGVLSGPFAELPPRWRDAAVAAVMSLPSDVGLLSPRGLAPLMGELATRHRLNLLSREAVASALTLDARVLMSDRIANRALADALGAEGGGSALVTLDGGGGGGGTA